MWAAIVFMSIAPVLETPAVIIVGAGFSFNCGLVQPEVAKFTQVCSYDHSGIGWSDDGPADSCSLRVNEVHTALKNLGIKGPYVLVGHSLGGLVARVYAGRYPDEVAGMVFVDHAGSPTLLSLGNKPLPPPPPMPSAPSGAQNSQLVELKATPILASYLPVTASFISGAFRSREFKRPCRKTMK